MPRKLNFPPDGHGRSGIDITYIKRKRQLVIGGWYDTCVGIEPTTIDLGYLLRNLGVSLADCSKALAGVEPK